MHTHTPRISDTEYRRVRKERDQMTIRTPYRTMAALGAAALIAVLQSPQGHASPAPVTSEEQPGSITAPVAGVAPFDSGGASGGLDLTGQEVTGGANAGDAAELSVDAVYVDEFTGASLHYRIPRELESSTVHVGVAVTDEAGAEDLAGFEVELGTWDGDRCSSSSDFGSELDTRERLRSVHVAAGRDPEVEAGEDPCGEQDELVLIIGPAGEEEDLQGHEFELTVYEEPQPEDASAEEPDYDDLDWRDIGRDVSGAVSAEPGRSFAEATELDPGNTYDLSISPGEVQIYRVPLAWGERLQAEAFFPEPGDALSDQLSGMGSISLATLNPMRGIVSGDFDSLMSSMSTELRSATAPVAWENRFDSGAAGATLPGDYYLMLAADPHDDGEDVSLDFMLTLDTFDDAGVSAPAYPAGSEDARPDFSGQGGSGGGSENSGSDGAGEAGGAEGEGTEAAGSGEDGELTAVERIRSIGDHTGVVLSLAAFALLILATGSLFMVRAIRQQGRDQGQPQAGYQHPQQPPYHQPPQHWR